MLVITLLSLLSPEPPPSTALLGIASRDIRAVTHPFACGGCEQQLVIVNDGTVYYGGTGATSVVVASINVTIDWAANNNIPGECWQDPQCVQKKPCEIDYPVVSFSSSDTWLIEHETWNNTTQIGSGGFSLPGTHMTGLSGVTWQPFDEQHPGYWAPLDCGQRLEFRVKIGNGTETHDLTIKFVCTNCFHYN